MGATSADTQREITEIRKDVTSAMEELNSRAGRMLDIKSAGAAASGSPTALATVAIAGLAVGGFVAYRLVSGYRKRRTPAERLKRTVQEAAEEIGETFERAREAIPMGIRLSSREEKDGQERSIELQRSEPSMLKKVLWAALAACMMAAGGLVARRLSAAVWKAAMNEEPPSATV